MPNGRSLRGVRAGVWVLLSAFCFLVVMIVGGVRFRSGCGTYHQGTIVSHDDGDELVDTERLGSEAEYSNTTAKLGGWSRGTIGLSVLSQSRQVGALFPTSTVNRISLQLRAFPKFNNEENARYWVSEAASMWDFQVGPLVSSGKTSGMWVFEDARHPPRPVWRGIICMALLPLVTGFLLWSMAWWVVVTLQCVKAGRRERVLSADRCPTCNYDIRHLPGARCPECGTSFGDSNSTPIAGDANG